MIGSIIIAVLGYGLAVVLGVLGFMAILGALIERDTQSPKAIAGGVLFAAFGLNAALLTRWIVGL